MNKSKRIWMGAAALAAGLVLAVTLVAGALASVPAADFGDAPDASNSLGLSMAAYPGVVANFPTDSWLCDAMTITEGCSSARTRSMN
ncbi:MAG: hypothetical protein L0322_32375, partial [Chloroflexi bacterium]|nr:hypothetical protein [Chloroflexota bacterium]